MILEIFCSGLALTNCVLLGCRETGQGAIVDVPFDSSPLLLERIEELKLDMQMILITHSHWDHIAEVALLKKKLGIPVYIHALDAPNLRRPGSDGLPLLREVKGVEPEHLLQDGEVLTLGNLKIQVIHTPGHSPGGVCFYIPKESTLISGDTIFKGSIGNISFPTSEPDLMWDSLKKLSQLPPETRVIPGHGDETTIGEEHWLLDPKSYFG